MFKSTTCNVTFSFLNSVLFDDSSCIGQLEDVKEWFSGLIEKGPAFGYFPQPSKSVLVVHPSFVDTAESVFGDMGIRVVTGCRYLGGYVGDNSGKLEYISDRVERWARCVGRVAEAAVHQPQASYVAMVKSIQAEWSFFQRVVPDCAEGFVALRDSINDVFWPALFEGSIDDCEIPLFSLPTRLGGLGLRDPVAVSEMAYESSRRGVSHLVDAMKGSANFSVGDHLICRQEAKGVFSDQLKEMERGVLQELMETMDDKRKRAIERAVEWKTSGWLTVSPLASQHFDLSPLEFRDALALRYGRSLVRMPPLCDGCGGESSVQHALDCRKGGLVIRRHNEIRDSLGDFCNLAFGNAMREPVVSEVDGSGQGITLVADLGVRGVWQPQVDSLIDVRVVDTDAPSHINRPGKAVLATSEIEKKRKYSGAAEMRRATFTPFVVSVDGALGKEAENFVKHMADVLAAKWERNYAEVVGWLRASLSFSIIRATGWCLRGSRKKWKKRVWNDFEDGAGLCSVTEEI